MNLCNSKGSLCGLERKTHRHSADGPHVGSTIGWGNRVEVQQALRPHKSRLWLQSHVQNLRKNHNPFSCWQKWETSHSISADAGQLVRRMAGGRGVEKGGGKRKEARGTGEAWTHNHVGSDIKLCITVFRPLNGLDDRQSGKGSARSPKVTTGARARWTSDTGVRHPTRKLNQEGNSVWPKN